MLQPHHIAQLIEQFFGLPKAGWTGKTTAMTRFLSKLTLEGKRIRRNYSAFSYGINPSTSR